MELYFACSIEIAMAYSYNGHGMESPMCLGSQTEGDYYPATAYETVPVGIDPLSAHYCSVSNITAVVEQVISFYQYL